MKNSVNNKTSPQEIDSDHELDKETSEDSDYTSSSGSSSEDEDEDLTQETQSTGRQNQPRQSQAITSPIQPDTALKSRLATFIPQLQRANQELQASDNMQAHMIDNVEEHETRYIEMDLGLGVLSEQRDGGDAVKLGLSESEDESISDGESDTQRSTVEIKVDKSKQASMRKVKIEEI